MDKREQVIDLARSQVKVARFGHQGRKWNWRLDCIGLIVVAHKLAGFPEYDYNRYGRQPNPRQLVRELMKVCDFVFGKPRLGDIALMWGHSQGPKIPHHAGLYDPRTDTIIDAHTQSMFVREVPYGEPWRTNTWGFVRWRP